MEKSVSSVVKSASAPTKGKIAKEKKAPAPYSPYTIFFRLERMYILQTQCDGFETPSYNPYHYDAKEHPRPAKYTDIKLPPFWYSSVSRAMEEKHRKHRKQSGATLSKEVLTGLIAQSWKNIDPETFAYCKKLSLCEKERIANPAQAARSTLWSSCSLPQGSARPVMWPEFTLPASLPGQASKNLPSTNGDTKKTEIKPFFASIDHTTSAEPRRVPLKKRPIHAISSQQAQSPPTTVGRSYDDCFAAGVLHLIRYGSDASNDSNWSARTNS
jgi:hypothetical protein